MGIYITNNKKLLKILSLLVLLIILIFNIDANQDIWFMFAHGKAFFKTGFQFVDPLTIHEFSIPLEKWLCCVVFYLLGFTGTKILCIIIFFISFYIFYRLNKNFYITFLVFSIFAFLFSLRPSIISDCLFLLELLVLEKSIENKKYLIYLPIISFVLVQFHSTSWFVFVLFALPYFFKDIRTPNFRDTLKVRTEKISLDLSYQLSLFIYLILSVLSACINPNGPQSLTYPLRSLGMTKYIDIIELENLNILSTVGIIVLIVLSIKLFEFGLNGHMLLRHNLLFYGFLLMTMFSIRNVHFLLISCFILGKNVKQYKKVILAYIVLILGTYFSIYISYVLSINKIVNFQNLNLEIEQMESNSRVYSEFDLGSYLGYSGFKTYIDGRAEIFYDKINKKENILNEYNKIQTGYISIEDVQKKYDFDYYIVFEGTSINKRIERETDWELIYSDNKSVISDKNINIWKVTE